ncbi:MAG TPA: hypothetical protein VLK58_02165 [Conexibacter sp.]|nr:hypothetical protein [Conexibacter sp.]
MLATKAGASHELLQRLLDALASEPDAAPVDVRMCEVGEQAGLLRAASLVTVPDQGT